jgi:hypothetical protein
MGFKRFLVGLMGTILAYCGDNEDLWLIEQDFVKFGKKEAYEEYKKDMLKQYAGGFSTFAMQEEDSQQYVYLIPIKDYNGLKEWMQKRADNPSLSPDIVIPYLSTLNYTIASLQCFLPDCSYIPKGKESLTSCSHIYFYLFGVTPGNEGAFEAQLRKIAGEQAQKSGVCFRSWKILIGSDVPKYLVAVFANTEKQAQKRAEGLEFITVPMKNLLRSQKQGGAALRTDLSMNGE